MYHRQIPVTRSLTAIILIALLVLMGLTPRAHADAGVPGWRQSNLSGFGNSNNGAVSALDAFDSYLYAGTWNDNDGAQIWRTTDGRTWSQFTPSWPAGDAEVSDAQPFGGHLYTGLGNEANGGEIWRTDGTTWEPVATGGLGDKNNYNFAALAVFGGELYAATGNIATGIEMWRTSTGTSGSWTQVNTDGFGGGGSWTNVSMDDFGGYLYVGISRKVGDSGSRAELWRSQNGTTWTKVFDDGLGQAGNTDVAAMAEFRGQFYIGLRNLTSGGQVWRSTNGTTFTPVFTDGLGKTANRGAYGLFVLGDHLVVTLANLTTGAEIWVTPDGSTWSPVMLGGWDKGGANAWADYYDKAAVAFRDALYVGSVNETDGGEVWQMMKRTFLPLIRR